MRENTTLYGAINWPQAPFVHYASVQPLACVNDLFQFWAVSVHTVPKCFSCRHEKRFGIVQNDELAEDSADEKRIRKAQDKAVCKKFQMAKSASRSRSAGSSIRNVSYTSNSEDNLLFEVCKNLSYEMKM